MLIALILISIYISFVDIRTHRISNRTLIFTFLFLFSLSLFIQTSIHPLTALAVLSLSPLILWARIGGGDLKLLIVLCFFYIPITWGMASDFLLSFTLIATTFLVIQLIRFHSFAGSIALAPAICGAVIWCAR